jgi:hypothetical protein
VHVPSHVLDQFATLLRSPPFRTLFHEVAVPTAINMIAQRGGAQWRLLPRCQGGAMTPRLNRVQLSTIQYCAHRLDLREERQQAALRQLLASPTREGSNISVSHTVWR